MRILAITVDKTEKENVEYVPVKAKAGYMADYNDPEFIAALPKVNLPNLPKGKVIGCSQSLGINGTYTRGQ